MPSVDEAIHRGVASPLAAALGAGIDQISQSVTVTFTLYKRVVLPLDGFVFWVKADLLTPGALAGTFMANQVPLNAGQVVVEAAELKIVPGSVHHTTINRQSPDESFSQHQFLMTCQAPVDALEEVEPDSMWVARFGGLKLAFSSRNAFYRQANTYHYRGDALYSSLATQIIDDPVQLDDSLIVSNSLPVWLTLNQLFPVYPSYLAPDNKAPPYATVHIEEGDTDTLTASPFYDATLSRWQLARDRVRITFYGVRNALVMDWMDLVNDYTLANPQVMGLMNNPAVRDAKRGQVEFSILAQKKTATFLVNYYQLRVRDVARKLIKQVVVKYAFAGVTDPYDVVTFTPGAPVP